MTKTTSEPFGGAAMAIAASIFVISNDQLTSLKRIYGGASTFRTMSTLMWHGSALVPLGTMRRASPS
jgi:hypothetical protein